MKSNELFLLAERFAPIRYSEEFCSRYGAYDNSGLLVDCGNDVKKAVFSLDLSCGVVEYAEKIGAGAIVTHHPAIYAKLSSIRADDPLSGAVLAAARAGISVISMHLNLDAAEGGIDESLAEGIRKAAAKAHGATADETEKTERKAKAAEKIMYTFSCGKGGYGRVYDVTETSAGKLKEAFDEEFFAKHTLLFGKENKAVRRAASFCGAGADEEAIGFAAENGADLIVSSDFKHHILKSATERGMAVIAPTHYASEAYGFYRFYQKIAGAAGIGCEFFADETLL